ncbi:MAG TPA: hypothetical protein GX698_00410, partial [Acholeplasmataceae bacterium]|nr:hypothetical protein [Acholeplasmataceae bacterium]
MELILLLIMFIVIWALVTNYLVVHDIAKKKGYEHNRKIRYISMVPIYGNIQIKKLANLKPGVSQEELDYLTSPEVIFKKIGLVFTILLILTIIFIPVSLFVYVSFVNNFSRSLLMTFVIILLFLIHQGLVVEY